MTILNNIPEKFVGPSAWLGTDLQSRQSEWLYTLTADDISEIEHAARHVLSLGRDVGEITAHDFLATILRSLAEHVRKTAARYRG